MSWLGNLWSKIFRARTKQGDFGSSMLQDLGATGRPPRRDQATSIDAYNSMPINRAIVDRISSNVAANRWRLFQTRGSTLQRSLPRELKELIHSKQPELRHKTIQRLIDGKELTEINDHPLLALMRKPNPVMSGFEFRKVEQVWLEQSGEGFFVIERNGRGEPETLWPQVPWWIMEVPDKPDGMFKIRWRSSTREVPAQDMVWLRYLNPSNPYGRGSGIAQTLNNELDADEYAATTTALRMFNNGTPDLLIIAEGLRDKSAEVLREEWRKQRHPAYLRKHEPHFTNAKNLRVERLQDSMVDMNIVELRRFLTDIQIQAWGVPPEILGLIENSNRATINSAQFLYACNVLLPRLILWENILNETLVRMFGRTDLLLLFDNPIPEDREFALDVAKSASYAFEVDEIRELAELPKKETRLSQMHAVPTGVFLQSFDATAQEPVQPAPMEDEEEEDNPGHIEEDEEEEKTFALVIEEPIEVAESKQPLDDEAFGALVPLNARH